MDRLRHGDPGYLFVTAAQQTSGRGRQGRAWASPVGNLYASLALRDPAPPALAPQLGFVAGVALATTLRAWLGGDTRLRLKWPNDALFAGAKLAGILLESAVLPDNQLGCVIGFGVNCSSHPVGLAYPATDLQTACRGVAVEPAVLLAGLAINLEAELRRWDLGAGFASVLERWLDMAAGLGEPVTVTTPRHTMEGIFRGIDVSGRLLVETSSGVTKVDAGDVFLFPANTNGQHKI